MKLDRSLVNGIDEDEAKRACVEMLIVLARRLGAWLLAEGVEQQMEATAEITRNVHTVVQKTADVETSMATLSEVVGEVETTAGDAADATR